MQTAADKGGGKNECWNRSWGTDRRLVRQSAERGSKRWRSGERSNMFRRDKALAIQEVSTYVVNVRLFRQGVCISHVDQQC